MLGEDGNLNDLGQLYIGADTIHTSPRNSEASPQYQTISPSDQPDQPLVTSWPKVTSSSIRNQGSLSRSVLLSTATSFCVALLGIWTRDRAPREGPKLISHHPQWIQLPNHSLLLVLIVIKSVFMWLSGRCFISSLNVMIIEHLCNLYHLGVILEGIATRFASSDRIELRVCQNWEQWSILYVISRQKNCTKFCLVEASGLWCSW